MFRAGHMGPLNSLVHALFAITLLILTDSCDKRCLGARCWIVGSSGWTAWASVCLLWDRESTLWQKETAHNEKKGPQLTSPHSTHPSVQREAVWPKFTLPHLPRHLFSLLGKHLEKCMRKREEKKEYICLNTSRLVRGKENPDICRHIQPSSGKLHRTWMSDRESFKWFIQNFLNHLWRFFATADPNCSFFSLNTRPRSVLQD